jgi:hypothetical protein
MPLLGASWRLLGRFFAPKWAPKVAQNLSKGGSKKGHKTNPQIYNLFDNFGFQLRVPKRTLRDPKISTLGHKILYFVLVSIHLEDIGFRVDFQIFGGRKSENIHFVLVFVLYQGHQHPSEINVF